MSRPHVHHTYRLEQDIDEHFATMDFALGEQVKGALWYAMNKGDQRYCRETLKNLRKDIRLGRYCWWAQGETIQSSKTKVGAKPFPSVQVGIDEMNKTFQQCLEEYKRHKQKLQATYDEFRAAETARDLQNVLNREEGQVTITKRKGKSTIVRPSRSSISSTSSDQQVVEAEEEVDEEREWDDDDFDVGNQIDMEEEEDEDAPPEGKEGKLQLQKIRANQAKQKKKAEALIQQDEDQRLADIAQAALVKNVKESLTTRLLFDGQCYQKFLVTQKRMSTGKVPTVFVHKSMLPVSCLTMYMLGYGRPNHPRSTLRERLLEWREEHRRGSIKFFFVYSSSIASRDCILLCM